jgi:hypothetical protein
VVAARTRCGLAGRWGAISSPDPVRAGESDVADGGWEPGGWKNAPASGLTRRGGKGRPSPGESWGLVDLYAIFSYHQVRIARMRRYLNYAEQHLQRYVTEFEFRFNNRTALGVNDKMRAETLLKQIEGKRLTYRRPNEA